MNFKSTAKRVLSVQLKTLSKETLHKCAKDESIVDIDVFKSSVALYIVKFSRPVLRILNLKKSDGRLLVDVVEP